MRYQIRFLLLGDYKAGKSNLWIKFAGQKFCENHKPTIGIDLGYVIHTFYNTEIKFQIWDSSGQDQFKHITNAYHNSCAVLIFVYDVTSANSFSRLNILVADATMYALQTAVWILVGNKADLESQREITYEEGQKFANEHQMIFLETSAKNGFNVNNIFKFALAQILVKLKSGEINRKDPKSGINIIEYIPF